MNDSIRIPTTDSNSSTIIFDGLLPKIVLGCLLACLSIFTVCGNILVLYAIQTEKHLRTVSNLFILSLAVADLSVGLFVMPLSATMVISGRWLFSAAICKMWLSIDYVASTASIFNLVLLSLDRYWAVVYPLRYLRKRTRRRATVFILTVWLVSILWAPAVIFWSYIAPKHSETIKKHECDTEFRSNKTFKTLTALVNFYLPLLTMIVISCRIMVAIRLRSTMELGQRLSSSTQKQMRQDRALTFISIRNDNQALLSADYQPSAPTIISNTCDSSPIEKPSISNNLNTNTNTSTTEPGQCFCSTCHTCNGIENDGLWELQTSPIKTSSPTSRKSFSFAQVKPISMLFSSKKKGKDKKNSSKNINSTLKPTNISNKMKISIVINPNDRPNQKKSPKNKRSTPKTSSISSSFSDEFTETVFINSNKKERNSTGKNKSKSGKSITSDISSPRIFRLKVPAAESLTSNAMLTTTTGTNHLSTHLSAHKTTKMNFGTFFNTLINPSNSSSLQKELKAARQLGMLVGVFTVSWLPYFILFLVVAWCNNCVSETIFTASIWLGYLNSTFNPLIYPLCNVHFRRAFQKICYCKHAKTNLPNLNALRELHALHSMARRR